MTRMIERWFPCAEVSKNSGTGWGSGNTERNLFTWFAARPTAQAKAAVICSLLPWPDEEDEQKRLQNLVLDAMTGRYAAWKQLRTEIAASHPDGASVLDPFSGRGMIPLEAARLGVAAHGIDYSPVAALASQLLVDYPFRDWSKEPALPFAAEADGQLMDERPRLLRDVDLTLRTLTDRYSAAAADLYPPHPSGRNPWGYLWAVTLPCQECGHRFPLVGNYELRKPSQRRNAKTKKTLHDPGQAYYIEGNGSTGEVIVVLHEGPPRRTPILSNATDAAGKKIRGKSAICPHCGHVHAVKTHQALAGQGLGADMPLLAADVDPAVGKSFRPLTEEERVAALAADALLAAERPFGAFLPATPDERIPAEIGALIRPQLYGAKTYGDLMCSRQTLATVRLARLIDNLYPELTAAGISQDYAKALSAFAAAVLVRKLRRSTRGCTLDAGRSGVHDIYANQGTITFSYDYFEPGSGEGPGTWHSLVQSSVSTLKSLLDGIRGESAAIQTGNAIALPFRPGTISSVVTDPPYDALIYYSDSSDYFYAWLKRALATSHAELSISANQNGLQNKADEIIVWGHRAGPDEHRDRDHYDSKIQSAFAEMRRVVQDTGLVTIVFGHGEPEVWQRFLTAISEAGLVMAGSWPANTEAGSANGGMANIETTLTMACRPARADRAPGRKGAVESQIKAEIKLRFADWERWGLAPADMLMAAAGPAMEIVGRYSEILDAKGGRADIHTFLPLARAAVQEAMAVEIDHYPLETFDARTRFALWWVRLYGKQPQAKSELRWQALASSLDMADVRDLVPATDKGVAFTSARNFLDGRNQQEAPVIDVALSLAAASEEGLAAMAEVIAASGMTVDDGYLWAAVKFLADRLPGSDPDAVAFHRLLRTRESIAGAASNIVIEKDRREKAQQDESAQLRLL